MNPPQSTSAKGASEKIYFDAEAKDLLAGMVVKLGIPKSNVICGFIRVASGGNPRPGEEGVAAMLKRAIARDQFIAFLKAVAEAMPKSAEPLLNSDNKDGYEPEAWRIKDDVGVLAFYCPSENNIGALFAKASTLKAKHDLTKLFVVTTNGNSVEQSAKKDLAAANIVVLSLADLAATIKHALKLK